MVLASHGTGRLVLAGHAESRLVFTGDAESRLVLAGDAENCLVFAGNRENRLVLTSHEINGLVLADNSDQGPARRGRSERSALFAASIRPRSLAAKNALGDNPLVRLPPSTSLGSRIPPPHTPVQLPLQSCFDAFRFPAILVTSGCRSKLISRIKPC
jgi:hypothetical protein